MKTTCNITTIWGGTGSINVLLWLKHLKHANLAAIVTSSDSGGSAGELRDEFGMLPPGDVRRAIAALAENTEMVRKMFDHRFDKSRIKGHTIGNLLITGLTEMTGSFEEAIDVLSDMFNVRGKVIPVTLDKTELCVELEWGQKIIGETNIDIPKHDWSLRIKEAYLMGGWTLNPRAREAIIHSDYIIIGPGDLYTSIVPNLLAIWMKEALQKSKAKVIYICNIMTKYGETNGFWVQDFVDVIERYTGSWVLDFVLVNSWEIREDLAQKYLETEKKVPVILNEKEAEANTEYSFVERDLTSEHDFVRHDPKKLGRAMTDFLEGWIK